MVKLENFRITTIDIDMSGGDTVWILGGYYITDYKKIFGSFLLRSDNLSFVPSYQLQTITSALLNEAHSNVSNFIWKGYEPEKDQDPTQGNFPGDAPREDRNQTYYSRK